METNKNIIRKEILKLRKQLPSEIIVQNSEQITDLILNEQIYKDCKNILIYANYNNEVITDKLILISLMKNKKVYLPKVKGNQMEFYRIFTLEELTPGNYGIREPLGIEHLRYEYDSNDSLIIMPLAACDLDGNRIGYGGGFYDKYLEDKPDITKVGIAYECQIVQQIENEITDIRLEYICTENNFYEVKK